MQFQNILDTVRSSYSTREAYINHAISVTSAELCLKTPVKWDSHILYIGDHAQDLILPDYPVQILLCSKPELSADSLKFHNIAWFESCDFITLFNEVNQLIFQNMSYTANYTKLLSMNLQNESLQTLVDEASSMVENPLIVLDSSYKILCSSKTYPIQDFFWSENIERGYCTYEFILAVNELCATQVESSTGQDAYPITCPASPYTKVFCNLLWRKSLIGYIIMLDSNQPVQKSHYPLLPKIAEAVTITLSKLPVFKGIHGSMKETILYQLLNEESQMNIDVRMKTASLSEPDCMQLLTLKYDSYSDHTVIKPYIKEQLLLAFPSCYLTEYESCTVVLIPFDKPQPFTQFQMDKLTSFFQNSHLKIACSDFFTSFAQVKKQYQICLELLAVCGPLQTAPEVIFFEKYRFYYLLSLTVSKDLLTTVLHPALAVLSSYDYENNTELRHTLAMYLEKNCSSKETANALFIHRNSLSYRLEKIVELTKINLNDAEELFQLNYSYRVEKYLRRV